MLNKNHLTLMVLDVKMMQHRVFKVRGGDLYRVLKVGDQELRRDKATQGILRHRLRTLGNQGIRLKLLQMNIQKTNIHPPLETWGEVAVGSKSFFPLFILWGWRNVIISHQNIEK
jgi:hypothetical protein